MSSSKTFVMAMSTAVRLSLHEEHVLLNKFSHPAENLFPHKERDV